ncbi:MAG: hypothetical protein WD689_05250 [Gaiellaceae bacterium]
MASAPAIEHRGGFASRWLRGRRLKLALAIAVVEGILVVVDVIPAWVAVVVGGAVLVYWFAVGRQQKGLTRELSWTAAMSQVFVALVPLLAFVLTALAVVALVVIAIVALVALLADRR